MTNEKKVYDLEERTELFGENIIEFIKTLSKNYLTIPLIDQLLRSSTSIGANYFEADCAESRKDFEHKLGVCKKEAKETKHWLRMITKAVPESREKALLYSKESNELQLIFITIIKKSKTHTE